MRRLNKAFTTTYWYNLYLNYMTRQEISPVNRLDPNQRNAARAAEARQGMVGMDTKAIDLMLTQGLDAMGIAKELEVSTIAVRNLLPEGQMPSPPQDAPGNDMKRKREYEQRRKEQRRASSQSNEE